VTKHSSLISMAGESVACPVNTLRLYMTIILKDPTIINTITIVTDNSNDHNCTIEF